ncbi:uncharacterized protein LOC135502744 isoform X2 [Lineus longissimus]|uniref:uncharacterized protein LOC135502744 isoform X2 n=1 Tax=Lineus longissimus TaxID=88925 RepID=UPI00315DF5AE
MVRKKARLKADQPWPCCWSGIGCDCSLGLLFFLSFTLATSFFIYLVVTASLPPVGWINEGHCENKPGAVERTEINPPKTDKLELGKATQEPHRWQGQLFQMVKPADPKFNTFPDDKWMGYMRSLGLVSVVENNQKMPPRTLDSISPNELADCSSEKCLSSSEISPFRQWTLFFRALAMFKVLWDRHGRDDPQCQFILDMRKRPTFYSYSRTYYNDKLTKFDSMECRVNVSGTLMKAGAVFDTVLQDVFVRRLLSAEEMRRLASRMTVTCGTITSCLKANIMDELQNSKFQSAGIRRRLLAVADDITRDAAYSYPVALMCGLSSFLIIFIAILCVCNKKTSTLEDAYAWKSCNRSEDPDIMLKQVTPRVDRRSINIEASAAPMNNERHSVHVIIEEKRKSAGPISITENGPYQLGHSRNDSRSSARGGTLDRRLPAIPIVDPTPSCDDEPDDTYDTIAPTKVAAQNKTDYDTRTDTSDSKTDEGSLRYEPVRMREDVYAEVTDVKQEPAKERRVSPDGVRVSMDEMYEVVGKRTAAMSNEEKCLSQMQRERINHESPYSRLPDDESELSGDGVVQRPRSHIDAVPTNSLPRAQSDEVYEMYDTVADESARNSRSFDSNEDGLFEDDNYASVEPPPPVPDRQYSPEEILSQSSGAQSPSSPIRTDRNAVVLPPLVGPGAALPVPGDGAMSDPPYSQVTARESLASIRERHQGQMSPVVVNEYDSVDNDNVYEPVDDQPEPSRHRAHTIPNDGACDWYSEIDCTAAARHSVEVGGLYSDIDASSPELRDITYIDEDPVVATSPVEIRARSFTIGSTPNHVDDIYANVDKSKKTVRRPPENLPMLVEITTAEKKDVHPYAVVDKSKKRKNRVNNDENTPPIASPENYNDTGARPKIQAFTGVRETDKNAGRESLDSSGYQTVDKFKPETESSSSGAESNLKSPNGHLPSLPDELVEPGYATVADDDDDDGTLYDEIRLENGTISNGAKSEGEKEEMFHMSNHKVPEDFWVRQEPVYSEVDEDDSPTIIPVTVL